MYSMLQIILRIFRVWVWGWGVHGQLGLGSSDDILLPIHARIMDDLVVSYIAAGFNHTAILTHEVNTYMYMLS